jgi:phosphonate transport system permease protein
MAKIYTLSNGKQIKQPFNKLIIPTIASTAVFLIFLNFVLQSRGVLMLDQLTVIFLQMFTPAAGKTWGDYFSYILTLRIPLEETLRMSFIGTVLGGAIALPFSIVASSNVVKTRVIYGPIRFIVNIVRTIPVLVYAVIGVFFFGLGALSGIMAITIFTFGIMTKMLYDSIETLDMGPYEALQACGATKLESFAYGLYPQLLPMYLGYLIYNFEINIRSSVILGYVGAGGLGIELRNNMDSMFTRSRVGGIIILILAIVVVIQALTNFVRRRLL